MSSLPQSHGWHAGFLALLPAVQTHAKIQFRHLRPERREDAIQEAIAAACVGYKQASAQGKLHAVHPGMLATFAVRHVRQGRHVGGKQEAAKDPLSTRCQKRNGVTVDRLSMKVSGGGCDGWRQSALEDRSMQVADLAAFRIDFAEWLRSQADRHRKIIDDLASGTRTCEVADRFGMTDGRISQLRNRYRHDWLIYQGETA